MTEGQTNSTEISEGVVTEIQRDSRQHLQLYIFKDRKKQCVHN